ncbi:short-chain fatty acid transporter [Aquimarina sp. U1-2]|uniref:TIGR00366 family protein n=1 Tax=Aquimarina sp. U1-2 TaxID=2823141 RepID=UPI001AEC7AAD|nr:TIGR00366 family protein [Aquimarina sp. U1-2]MBP2831033.1 short-chain fatty acid transporter [Aquimarina sp. U1-2]
MNLSGLGERFANFYRKYIPNSMVFAFTMTILVMLLALIFTDSNLITLLESWYTGMWELLGFSMQVVLMLILGYAMAVSPQFNQLIKLLARYLKTPRQVYFLIPLIGALLCLVNWTWLILTAVLAREIAKEVKGIHYPYLMGITYFSGLSWVSGISSTVLLLLNTPDNYLIQNEVITNVLPTALTLGSRVNYVMVGFFVIVVPVICWLLAPVYHKKQSLDALLITNTNVAKKTDPKQKNERIEAKKHLSGWVENVALFPYIIVTLGLSYIIYHFYSNGFELNLNIVIFIFMMLALLLHRTPAQFGKAIKEASGNISGVIIQYPFYAGIMGIFTFAGLGEVFANSLSEVMTLDNYIFYSYGIGGAVNFAIPGAGGEFAIIGPGILQAVTDLSARLPPEVVNENLARATLAITYGENCTNMLQPFFFMVFIIPIMGVGTNIQSKDIMGYLFLPFVLSVVFQLLIVAFVPV